MIKPPDHPFHEVIHDARALIAKGAVLYQKWTCELCGERVAMLDQPNVFYATATHADCPINSMHVTNIEANGCNYLLVQRINPTEGESPNDNKD